MNTGIFTLLLTQPIYNLLVLSYNAIASVGIHDLGLAIITLTVAIKLVLLPFTAKSVVAQRNMQALQPKIEAIKSQYKGDKEGQAKAMMALYKEHNINPLSSCLPILVQMPVLLALYYVLSRSVTDPASTALLYSFVSAPEIFNTHLFSLVDLSVRSIPLAVVAGLVQYVQGRMMQVAQPPKELQGKEATKDESMAAAMTKSMTYTMPLITVIFGASLPGGVTLYWLISGLVSVIQQWILMRKRQAPAA
ncbi:membrane protein insertase YidC [Candidatus Uhrbacteria bacterium]|nr:membrane protein insertase YidC [Candidatus Uhrbacteria bacterium]